MPMIIRNNIRYATGGGGNTDIVKLTQAEYDALPESKYTDGILYAITDGESSSGSTSKPVELTKAQYEALGDSVLTDGILYAITDGDELSAKNLEYDGSETGLGNTVQSAIDDIGNNINELSVELAKRDFIERNIESLDANEILTTGIYNVGQHDDVLNYPSLAPDGNGVLLVYSIGNGAVVVQIFIHYESTSFVRMKWYDRWWTWRQMTD